MCRITDDIQQEAKEILMYSKLANKDQSRFRNTINKFGNEDKLTALNGLKILKYMMYSSLTIERREMLNYIKEYKND